ncbi:PAS domain S-box protein [Nannocystis sp. SCPEA4]|uniref:protein kinase domain-containing protein n=1 Tax=Nannocystis sp. SCPEA4 TaxID=2996787 RepID=UPI00226EE13D|nr:PAS domain S-box protein [Nannocystis sp. SCPEA4]MCY1054165.1 PAS domain S-box protein [Nannocystis sp. SCPEA4]
MQDGDDTDALAALRRELAALRSERDARSAALFEAVAATAIDAIVTIDVGGIVTQWNRSAERIFGRGAAEMLGADIAEIIPADFRDAHRAGLVRARDTGTYQVVGRTVELEGLRAGGARFPIELSLSTWRHGDARYFTAIVRDISERKQGEQQLRLYIEELARKNTELERSHNELLRSNRQIAQLFSAVVEALPGSEIDGRYALHERIGTGGFSVVYRGSELASGRPVAIKVFRPSGGVITSAQLARFGREGEWRIRHPNAAVVLDFGVARSGIPYLVMELLTGETLADARRRGPPPRLGRVLAIALIVAEVLQAAHADGILHRDIKPENLFLHRDEAGGEVLKVLDFGIAKFVRGVSDDASVELTGTGHVLGTPRYIAPERLTGAEYDGRSDVYSLGVLLYELVVGVSPLGLRGRTPWEAVTQHMTHQPRPLHDVDPGLPRSLSQLIDRTLAKDPETRPRADELVVALREIVAEVEADPVLAARITRVAAFGVAETLDDERTESS